ncbi:MAG: hypothetical protein JWN44_692, partial [Myxococcales bacterium]|nr:hypothetical protein [Myxococcales bacterium]
HGDWPRSLDEMDERKELARAQMKDDAGD